MTGFRIILLFFEVFSYAVIRDYYLKRSKSVYYPVIIIHFTFSLLLWFFMIKVISYKGFADDPRFINDQLILTGLLSGILIPRSIMSLIHYTGKILRRKRGGYTGWLTTSGMILSMMIFLIIGYGSFIGRFNFKTEEVTIKIKDMDPALDGVIIAHLSDLHLSSFYNHAGLLDDVMKMVAGYKPDLIVNTGDFITIGMREFGRFDTVLSPYRGKYGNYAVLGNHDMGTYLPDDAVEEQRITPAVMSDLITNSGYKVLNDENELIEIKGVKVAVIGVKTSGSHPGIIHGDLKKAAYGTDSASFKILLLHDPNQWDIDVAGRTDIQLSLAGHTHGMQIGIITKNFRWSPAKIFYPKWNGLYSEGTQYLYVNRGLGLLGMPFRIWMPPEITIITLRSV